MYKELEILCQLRHQYIVTLIESFENKNELYIVMEYATGGDLFDRLESVGCFTERDAVHIISMLLKALNYLHWKGIVHRDLKPENILFYHTGPDSNILVSDFGLSTMSSYNSSLRTICGTLEYMAPEILAERPYTQKVDMWAVGVMTYYLLSGTLPFQHEHRAHLFRLILKVRYSFEDEVLKIYIG